uniref:S1 motif domain-containing protein n=1 Tax=Anopheles maculatus TaxID=74869 RepID=A0A182ST61_9DIPT
FIDGLVHVSTLDNDYYRYDNIGQRLIGESSGMVYRLGDTVEIRVDAVHMDERKIDFALVSSTRKPRGEGKTERERAKNGGGRTLRNGTGASRTQAKPKRRGGKPPANFEPDSAFRKEGVKSADKVKKDKKAKAKKPSDKTKKIAAATKAKRASKSKGAAQG